ncbi:MAG: acetyl-CoA hydrolase/transferase C-terminal domain-containing protein [Syntrophomonadaceae bacterium]|nr:butyryl-CoA:acetate CoA-transferase [Syntrophomonadaceae bacterium]MDH7498605.1 acetyl-CoA hydrolase/transferase C-terminal domain-containing protein [Syntrophomonadaceae bacterium]
MDYMHEYRQKVVTADQAAGLVKSNMWIEYAFGICSAYEFDEALAKRKDELYNVNIRCDIGSYPHFTAEADPSGEIFTWNSWHVAAHDKKYIGKNLYYIPMKFHENPMMTRKDCVPDDIIVIMTTPMDEHGYFNFGASAATTYAGIETAKTVIVEVNKNMPRVLGGEQECIHISQVDYVIETKNPPLMVLPAAPPSETDKAIAHHIMERLYDGCCLQLGIGGIPNAVGTMIAESDLQDLGVHTEMYVDAYLLMARKGKITGAKKRLNRYKQVFAFAMGSQELYDYIDNNPGVAAFPVDYTNNPSVVAQIDDFVSINACVEVDLFGQVCSESVGTRHLSGTGGQLDFVEGAYKSKGGQSFVCLASTITRKDGTLASKINATLTPGAIVTDPRTATHMLVTEFGVANMKGKSTWERAEALVKIAHPMFQDQLIADAAKMGIWRRTNKR